MNPITYFKSGAWKGTAKVVGRKVIETRPEIMLVVGGVSLLAGTVYACVKTPQAKEVIDATKKLIEAEENLDNVISGNEENDAKKVLTKEEKIQKGRKYFKIYAKSGFKIARLYAVPGLLWFGGIASICGAHGELRMRNTRLLANSVALKQLFNEYRGRVSDAVGAETENKIFLGAQEGMVEVIEQDEKTGKEKLVQKKADVFVAQPGSIFARNFTKATCDAFDIRSYADYFLDSRIENINRNLELGVVKFYSGAEIMRILGFNETELDDNFIECGISGNARKVQDPGMCKLKVNRLQGYEKVWDEERGTFIYRPCLRLDFNFYPLKGTI